MRPTGHTTVDTDAPPALVTPRTRSCPMRRSIAGALLLAFSTPAMAQTDPARVMVQGLDNGLLAIMKAKGT